MPSECPVCGMQAVGFTAEDWWRHFDSDCNPLGKLYTFVEKPDDGDDAELMTDGGEPQETGKEQLECEVCGISIENDANLAPIEYKGETVQGCPGCHGAAGGGQ